MNTPTSSGTIMKISQGISLEVNVGNGLKIGKGNLSFEDTAKEIIKTKIYELLERLSHIKKDHELPRIEQTVVGNVDVILSSPKHKGLARITDKLKAWRKRKDSNKEPAELSKNSTTTKISHDPFGEIYLVYLDDENIQKTFPVPFTIRLSDTGLDWQIYWEVLLNALSKKFQYSKIFSEKKKQKGS